MEDRGGQGRGEAGRGGGELLVAGVQSETAPTHKGEEGGLPEQESSLSTEHCPHREEPLRKHCLQ